MKKNVKKIAMGMIFAMLTVGCSKIEVVELPAKTSTEQTTKSETVQKDKGFAELDIFFYNAYFGEIEMTLKHVEYCVPDNIGGIEKTVLFDGEMDLEGDAALVAKLNVPASTVYSNIYIECVYDAVQISNGCCLAKDDVIKNYMEYDACNNRIKKWEKDNVYTYAFSPKFEEITFNPSVGNWD